MPTMRETSERHEFALLAAARDRHIRLLGRVPRGSYREHWDTVSRRDHAGRGVSLCEHEPYAEHRAGDRGGGGGRDSRRQRWLYRRQVWRLPRAPTVASAIP